MARTWPSRNEINAISDATNNPSSTISASTIAMLIRVEFIGACDYSPDGGGCGGP